MEITGVRHRDQLAAEGFDASEVLEWVRRGAVRRIPPWYVTPEAPETLVVLLEHGLRPTCIDGAAFHGIWTPIDDGVHVFRPRADRRAEAIDSLLLPSIRSRHGELVRSGPLRRLVIHQPSMASWPDDDPVPSIELVLEHAARCLPVVKVAILFESAIHRGKISLAAAQEIVDRLPTRLRRSLSRIRADAESGTETAVRWWFESRRFRVRAQVPFLDDAGTLRRMDLLVGTSWVIECDSRSFHDDPTSYQADRARDLFLRSKGYIVSRLTWEQVFLEWAATEAMLGAVLARGDHRRPVVDRLHR